jgi:hypothetical protein
MIKLNHELPLNALHLGREINDYDFILPHLLDQYPEYLEYFIDAKRDGRYIMMDNSLHELKDTNDGKGYDQDKFLEWVNKLEPNAIFVPDVWENIDESLHNAHKWSSINVPADTEKIAVIQAKNIHEAIHCTQEYIKMGYKYLAFSYGAEYYSQLGDNHKHPDINKAQGRANVIKYLKNNEIINDNISIHLLGTMSPYEYGFYRYVKNIKTADTSNPVMAALDGVKYKLPFFVKEKPKSNLNNHFTIPVNQNTIELIKYNSNLIKLFT